MDKRLNQIQTGTLTESRLNDDFVFWLKSKGLNYLLVILLAGCAYMGYQWWSRIQSQTRAEAWLRLERASTPQELAVVATEESGLDSIALLAKLRAANTYLDSIMRGQRFDRDPDAPDAKVTTELRVEWLENADQLFGEVGTMLSAPGTPAALMPARIHALVGRSTVAEARGDAPSAKKWLGEAEVLAVGPFEPFAEILRKRAEGAELASLGIELPPRASLPTAGTALPLLQTPSGLPPGLQISTTPGAPGSLTPRPTVPVPFAIDPSELSTTQPIPVTPAPAPSPTPPPASAPPPAPPPASAPPPAPPPAP